MKFFLLLSGLLAPTFASTLNCGEGRVKDWMNVCISPEYIPACKTYKSETECHECQNNYKVNAGKCEAEDANVPPPKMMGCLEGDEMHRCLNCANGIQIYYVRF